MPCLDCRYSETFARHTRREAPQHAFSEAWVIVGRGGGKSRIAALSACYLAFFPDHSTLLAPGERGVVMYLAADRRQARAVFSYIRGLIQAVPMLQDLVEVERRESIDLTNGVSIEVHTASYRAVRGYTVLAAICDETAFWRSEDSSNPDSEVLAALRPSMASVPGAVLLSISTPYARRGELWRAYEQYFGRDDSDVLVWQADTRAMNPTISERVITQAYERDSVAASAEYGGLFRKDVEAFISPDALAAVIMPGRFELPHEREHRYTAFTDPSGGSQDSYPLAVAHSVNGVAVLDVVREARPPFSPEKVRREFAEFVKSHGLKTVIGDRYGGQWPVELWANNGVTYRHSTKTKSELYTALLPLVNSGQVELLDNRTLRVQLEGLDRKVARSGKDSIDHSPGGHDDLANAAAGTEQSTSLNICTIMGTKCSWRKTTSRPVSSECRSSCPADLRRNQQRPRWGAMSFKSFMSYAAFSSTRSAAWPQLGHKVNRKSLRGKSFAVGFSPLCLPFHHPGK